MEKSEIEESLIFSDVAAQLQERGFAIERIDRTRPWGGFLTIQENQAERFASVYFPDLDITQLDHLGKLSPKMLLVAPHRRLSWQYHHHRAEIWQVVQGPVGVISSFNDVQGVLKRVCVGERIYLPQGMRHRLIGLRNWGVVAELWQHTDRTCPSNEEDIVRLQDDFARESIVLMAGQSK